MSQFCLPAYATLQNYESFSEMRANYEYRTLKRLSPDSGKCYAVLLTAFSTLRCVTNVSNEEELSAALFAGV
jgi:hypothetical protein